MKFKQHGVSMSAKPPIPTLIVIPSNEHDFGTLYAIATAYAHSGQLLNEHAERTEQIAFTFPAMVCSSFAVELLLKFFLTLGNADNPTSPQDDRKGHYLSKLWERVKPIHQDLIASMFRNPQHTPIAAGLDTRKTLLLQALDGIGAQPFVEWRYAHEIKEPKMMSQGSVAEVLDAFGYAAEYVMNERHAAATTGVAPDLA